jgi:MoaA/NifB/PqqE/SkfB family radical SAM enzyme
MGLTLGKIAILSQWLFTKKPTSVALDVTDRCNLKCGHCYWWKQDHPQELSDHGMISLMRDLRSQGLRAAILYGGEPTLRPEVCMAAAEIFDATLAFTNGTNGFPQLVNGQWILSLDGPRDINDAIRGDGVYDTAIDELSKAADPPIVHITVSKQNQHTLDDFVKDMVCLPVKGIGFSFLTPNRHENASEWFIPLEERDRILFTLLSLRKKYGEKVGFTKAMARQLTRSGDFPKWNHVAGCPVSERVRCYKSNGQPKMCTYGDEADCSRCGCAAVVAYRGAFNPFDYETIRLILGLMVPEYR